MLLYSSLFGFFRFKLISHCFDKFMVCYLNFISPCLDSRSNKSSCYRLCTDFVCSNRAGSQPSCKLKELFLWFLTEKNHQVLCKRTGTPFAMLFISFIVQELSLEHLCKIGSLVTGGNSLVWLDITQLLRIQIIKTIWHSLPPNGSLFILQKKGNLFLWRTVCVFSIHCSYNTGPANYTCSAIFLPTFYPV